MLQVAQPQVMGKVLGIVYRAIETHIIKQAGETRNTARTGAVTLIQRFGSALNLNIHFHMLFLDITGLLEQFTMHMMMIFLEFLLIHFMLLLKIIKSIFV